MNKKGWFGVGLVITGVGLLFPQQISSITGFAVSSGPTYAFSWLKFLGMGLMIGGFILLTQKEELEDLFGDDTGPLKKEIQKEVLGKKGVPSYNRKVIYGEIYDVVNGTYGAGRPHLIDVSHKLSLPAGTQVFTRDANALNDSMNFSRSGIYRHVYDRTGSNYLGIAKHVSKGTDIQWVYRLKKPVKVKTK